MAGFDDLIQAGQPAVVDDGARGAATEGRTWYTLLEAVDGNGDPIDFTGIAGTCEVWDGATLVTTIPVALSEGAIELVKAADATDGLAAGIRGGRRCTWGLRLYDLSREVQIWSPDNSFLTIHNDAGV